MNKIKRSALVGAGVIGMVHAESMATLGMTFGAICDVKEDRARAIAENKSPDASIYTDYAKMIDEFSPEVVHICTPHYLHAEMIIYALERGINVLCEKPLCISRKELDAVLEAEKRSDAQLGVCFQNRYLDANKFAKAYLSDKTITGACGSVFWSRTAEYYRSDPWRGTLAQEGGGVLINQAIHTLDLVEWFCGEPEYVTAETSNVSLKGEIEVEDTAMAFFDGKQPFSFFATNAAPCNMPVSIELKLSNKEHIILSPDSVIINGQVCFNAKLQKFVGKSYYGNGHIMLISDFYSCLNEKRPFPINGEEASKVMRLVLAVYESRGEKIRI